MASNVFGDPVTTKTLEAMPEYIGKDITRLDRAQVAMEKKNENGKAANARKFVENLKSRYGSGVSTLCTIYNATGDTLKFVGNHDWSGHIGESPYPSQIANGQWGAYLHVKTSGAARGSVAACVYRGLNNDGSTCDWMLAWNNPFNGTNTVYAEIREGRHYETDHWNYIGDKLADKDQNYTGTWGGCVAAVSIGQYSSPSYEGIMTLQGASLTKNEMADCFVPNSVLVKTWN